MNKKTTHFGFKTVEHQSKQILVQDVFSTVASKYDLMNDLMSFGLHRFWKDEVIQELNPDSELSLLDVAGGTGDIAYKFLKAGGGQATVFDLNKEMLENGKLKYPNSDIKWINGNAEKLPFQDESFDLYTISFGIRNVTNIDIALKEAHRVLKVGGKFVCLEFSNVSNSAIKKVYDFYSFKLIPKIGEKVTGSKESYDYLVESIRKFPTAEKFKTMIEDAGFEETHYRKFSFGAVAMHVGYKVKP